MRKKLKPHYFISRIWEDKPISNERRVIVSSTNDMLLEGARKNIKDLRSDLTRMEMRVEALEQDMLGLDDPVEVKTTGDIPVKKYDTDIGYDLAAAEDTIIYGRPQGFRGLIRIIFSLFKKYPNYGIVKTNFDAEFDPAVGGFIYSRSGLAAKNGIGVLNGPGVIEGTYREKWGVILFNMSDQDLVIKKGDRIAQAIWIQHKKINIVGANQLSDTDRGKNGLGSTGVNTTETKECSTLKKNPTQQTDSTETTPPYELRNLTSLD